MNDNFIQVIQETINSKKDKSFHIEESENILIDDSLEDIVKKNIGTTIDEKKQYTYKKITRKKVSAFEFIMPIILILLLLCFIDNFVIMKMKESGFISIIIMLFSIVIGGVLTLFVTNDILGLIKINKLENIRRDIQKKVNKNDVIGLKTLLISYQSISTKQKEAIVKGTTCSSVIAKYEKEVMKSYDEQADKVIKEYALLSSSATVLSSKAWLDIIITQIFFSKLVIDLAKIYNVKLGICSFIKLSYIGLIGSSYSTITTNILNSFIPVEIVKKTGEISISMVIIAQLGLKIKYAIRPIIVAENDFSLTKTIKLILGIK